MNKHVRSLPVGSLLVLASVSSWAGPTEAAKSAASQASAIATKVEKAVVHGAHVAASAVEHAASVASQAVAKTAKKVGLPASGASAPK